VKWTDPGTRRPLGSPFLLGKPNLISAGSRLALTGTRLFPWGSAFEDSIEIFVDSLWLRVAMKMLLF
jgi:hypothetical protein